MATGTRQLQMPWLLTSFASYMSPMSNGISSPSRWAYAEVSAETLNNIMIRVSFGGGLLLETSEKGGCIAGITTYQVVAFQQL
jgi:hypothetical protein